jgi:hypothetical protein
MSQFKIGDEVEVIGEMASRVRSRIGVIKGIGHWHSQKNFTVALVDGTESVFLEPQLRIPPVMFADKILDTDISPTPRGLRGSTSGRHMRFVCREFDVYLKLIASARERRLLGQLLANELAPEISLVTLVVNRERYASSVTDPTGQFKFDKVPSKRAVLEILVSTRRIVAALELDPDPVVSPKQY